MPTITLPTFHPGQVAAFKLRKPRTKRRPRFLAVRCGRRWGKTDFGKTLAVDAALKGQSVFWGAPDYKIMAEAYNEIVDLLAPVKRSSSKIDGVIRTTNGGRIDFWTLENERAGRSRKYHLAMIDEAAFAKASLTDIWRKSIMPTLLDYLGRAVVFSNTNGVDQDNFFWRICHEEQLADDERFGFVEYHAPSSQNPYLPREELERLERTSHPLVFAQEYKAEFIDWSGVAFFALDKLLVKGEPVARPVRCDVVFAVIDSATKTGTDNDGTAVTYYAYTRHLNELVVLDWDVIQIEGDLLIEWVPTVFTNLEMLARATGARAGSVGVFIEDKASGEILLQQLARRGFPAHAIESRLTALGKDERALSVSGYVYTERVKICAEAYNKTVVFKNISRNHLVSQVTSFRLGDKKAATRADDLLDTFTYGVALALGNAGGF